MITKDNFLESIVKVILKNEKFEVIDFKIELDHNLLKIIYLIEPSYYIQFKNESDFSTINQLQNYKSVGESYPYKFLRKEEFTLYNREDIYLSIENWLNIVWKYISLEIPFELLEEGQRYIDKFCEKHKEEEGYFNTEEILEIKSRLQIFKLEWEETLQQMELSKEIVLNEVKKLNYHINLMNETVLYMKKKGWIRYFLGRILSNVHRIYTIEQKGILSK